MFTLSTITEQQIQNLLIKKDWAEFTIFLQTQREVSIIERDMALILVATDNPEAGEKGELTCHICTKTGHFAR